jgi:hypothetical protein
MSQPLRNKTDEKFGGNSSIPASLLYLEKELKFFKPWVIGVHVESKPSLKEKKGTNKRNEKKEEFPFLP